MTKVKLIKVVKGGRKRLLGFSKEQGRLSCAYHII
jgi:hypothetical protein